MEEGAFTLGHSAWEGLFTVSNEGRAFPGKRTRECDFEKTSGWEQGPHSPQGRERVACSGTVTINVPTGHWQRGQAPKA